MSDGQKLTIRPMTQADAPTALYIRKAAGDWLSRTAEQEPQPWQPAAPRSMEHLLHTDPAGSFVAEVDGLVVGYAQGLLRGDIWFLSQLFVQPEVHGRGAGGRLLEHAMAYGKTSGARLLSVVASPSLVAHSLYTRAGMFCAGVGYRMSGPLEALRQLPDADANKKRIVDCNGWQDKIAALDLEVFGAERRQDHEWFLSGGSLPGEETSFGLTRDGELLGYGYAWADGGHISPLAAYDPRDLLPLLKMGAEWLLDRENDTGNIWVLSLNKTLLTAMLGAGWKIGAWSYFLTTEPFGKFDRYHPSGGILL